MLLVVLDCLVKGVRGDVLVGVILTFYDIMLRLLLLLLLLLLLYKMTVACLVHHLIWNRSSWLIVYTTRINLLSYLGGS